MWSPWPAANAAWIRNARMLTTLCYSIVGGMLAVVATVRAEQIAWRFLRLTGLIALALSVGVSLWAVRQQAGGVASTPWPVLLGFVAAVGAAGLAFVAPLAASNPGVVRAICGVFGTAGLAAACGSALALLAGRFEGVPQHRFASTLTVAGQLSGAMVLGSISVAWLLGHAYLTATKMTIAPLRRLSRTLNWSVACRILFLLVSVAVAWSVDDKGATRTSIIGLLSQSWLVASLRIGVGLLAVGVFSYMVADCVRLRSTQSATGILYFASIFAYIGELAALQLLQECGWPI